MKTKKKIKDVNYSSGEICQGSVDYLKQIFGFDDRTYINKQRVLDIILYMKIYYYGILTKRSYFLINIIKID